jgi:hypothetical protein
MNKIKVLLTLIPLSTQSVMADNNAYNNALKTIANAPAAIKSVMQSAPKTYNFTSTFDASKSSVSYTGQAFRQVLINDLYAAMTTAKVRSFKGSEEDAVKWLDSYYSYNESNRSTSASVYADSFFKIKAKDLNGNAADIDEGYFYGDIQSPGKNLVSKTAGEDNTLRRGKVFGLNTSAKTPKEQINLWFSEFSKNVSTNGEVFEMPNGNLAMQTVSKATVTKDGRDLAQLTQKFLHGAVSYSQAARDYFSTDLGPTKGLNADNSVPEKQGKSYTAMEHHFDEGFGYFGAARDYLSYTDLQIRTKVSRDSDKNDFISIKKEMNLGISYAAGRMDLTAVDQKLDLTNEAMTALLNGRHLITTKPTDYKKYVKANATIALGAWEKTIAGVVIHYINKTITSLDAYGTDKYLFTNTAKYWSEMKGYALAFQFNPHAIMTDTSFDTMHALMANSPVLPQTGATALTTYKADLLKARKILQNTYSFSEANVQGW